MSKFDVYDSSGFHVGEIVESSGSGGWGCFGGLLLLCALLNATIGADALANATIVGFTTVALFLTIAGVRGKRSGIVVAGGLFAILALVCFVFMRGQTTFGSYLGWLVSIIAGPAVYLRATKRWWMSEHS